MSVSAAIRTALIQDADFIDRLGSWSGEPAIHTRRPVPGDTEYPCAVIGPDVLGDDMDGLTALRPVEGRDVIVYGDQPDGYRLVEEKARRIRALFHRQRHALIVPGFSVIDIVARGPIPAPTDDETKVARAVMLTLRLASLS